MGANPSSVSYQLTAAPVSNGIAQAQTPLAAGLLTLNGSLVTAGVAIFDNYRRVQVSSTGADSAITFTIKGTGRPTGTNTIGSPTTEVITGVSSGNPQYSYHNFGTVTSVTVSGATAGAITVGTNGVGSAPWVVDDFLRRFQWSLAGGITGPTGTTYTLEHTYNDPNEQGFIQGITGGPVPAQWSMSAGGASPPHVYAYAGIIAASGDNQFKYADQPIFAHRLTINSGTGLVTMDSMQGGID